MIDRTAQALLTIHAVTLADIVASGDLDGYAPYTPTGIGASIDREVAEDTPCGRCGGRCGFRGFRSGASYRAFAVCGACGLAMEF